MKSPVTPFALVAALPLVFLPCPSQAAETDPVGYSQVNYGAGYSLIGSGLNDVNDANLSTLISGVLGNVVPSGTTLQTYTTGDYTTYTYTGSGWENESGNPAEPPALAMQFGAVLHLPEPTILTYTGGVAWLVLDEPNPPVPLPVAAPYAATIHLLQNVNPVDASGFNAIIGRAPVEGDAVLQLDPSGTALISRFSGGIWSNAGGGNAAPQIGIGHSAFFDLSGEGFDGFTLPNGSVVPEPASALLVIAGAALAIRRRRVL
jgi:hypothetical protein